MTEKMRKQLDFLIELDKLKDIFRQSLLPNSDRFENDAEHSWHLCMYAIVLEEYAKPGIDMLKVLKMALVHDLVEIYAGDTYLYDEKGNADKAIREEEAAQKLFSPLGNQGAEIKELWLEFERNDTAEAEFANMLDRLQPIMQNYLTKGRMWLKNGVSKEQVYKRGYRLFNGSDSQITRLAEEIISESVEKGYLLP